MFRVYKATTTAITVGIGTNGALVGGGQDGVIYFTGAIVEAGPRVQPALPAAGIGLQACSSASGDQVAPDFRSMAVRTVPVDVSVEVRGASSFRPLWVGDVRSKADVLTKYGGFKVSLLTANNGMPTLLRTPGMKPAFVMVTLFYQ